MTIEVTDIEVPTWNLVIVTSQGWGCGNNHGEARRNAVGYSYNKPHLLMAFSQPVKNVQVEWLTGVVQWEWADEAGIHFEIPVNGWGEQD